MAPIAPNRGELVRQCPDCGAIVVWPQNDVLLDWPAMEHGEMYPWIVVKVVNVPPRGSTRLIAYNPSSMGGASQPKDGRGHRLHEHQPPTSAVRRGRLLPFRPGGDGRLI